jgi:hypothetical protein
LPCPHPRRLLLRWRCAARVCASSRGSSAAAPRHSHPPRLRRSCQPRVCASPAAPRRPAAARTQHARR